MQQKKMYDILHWIDSIILTLMFCVIVSQLFIELYNLSVRDDVFYVRPVNCFTQNYTTDIVDMYFLCIQKVRHSQNNETILSL